MMKSAPSITLASFLAAAAVTPASCTGSRTMQNGAQAIIPNYASVFSRSPNRRKSWMEPRAASHKLLYISNGSDVEVFTYPGLTLAGVLSGFTSAKGECTDKAGNVWIADNGLNEIDEYAHGGTSPVNILTLSSQPWACSINLKTGDLAVTAVSQDVSVFHNAAGSPVTYTDLNFAYMFWLGYDSQGNLFVDGYDSSFDFRYAELPAGSSTFTDISLSTVPGGAGNVQWDGRFMAVGDTVSTVYQTQGSNVVSSITLSTTCLAQFYILRSAKRIVAPDACGQNADIYDYRTGGSPIKAITGGLNAPVGAVLSL